MDKADFDIDVHGHIVRIPGWVKSEDIAIIVGYTETANELMERAKNLKRRKLLLEAGNCYASELDKLSREAESKARNLINNAVNVVYLASIEYGPDSKLTLKRME